MMNIREIQAKFAREEIEFSTHAAKQMRKRGISLEELFEVIGNPECLEVYPEDKYGASVLLFGVTEKKRPLHVLVTAFERPLCKVITAYEPNPEEWEQYKIRRAKP